MCILYNCIICFCLHEFLEEGNCGVCAGVGSGCFVWGGWWWFLLLSVHHSYSYKPGREYYTRNWPPPPWKQLADIYQKGLRFLVPILFSFARHRNLSSATIQNVCHIQSEDTVTGSFVEWQPPTFTTTTADRAGSWFSPAARCTQVLFLLREDRSQITSLTWTERIPFWVRELPVCRLTSPTDGLIGVTKRCRSTSAWLIKYFPKILQALGKISNINTTPICVIHEQKEWSGSTDIFRRLLIHRLFPQSVEIKCFVHRPNE